MENNKYRNTNDIDDTEYRRMRKSEDSSYEYHEADAEDIDEANVDDGYPEIVEHDESGSVYNLKTDFIVLLPGEIIRIPQDSNLAWMTMFYALPRELVEKRPAYLELPRNITQLLTSEKHMKLIGEDAFLELVWDCYAWAIWQAIQVPDGKGGYKEVPGSWQNYSGDFPIWRLSYDILRYFRMSYETEMEWSFQRLFTMPKNASLPWLDWRHFSNLVFNLTDRIVAQRKLQPIIDEVWNHRQPEDYTGYNLKRGEFLRKWNHSRYYQHTSVEKLLDDEIDVPDTQMAFDRKVLSEQLVQQFEATLSKKDKTILDLRMKGRTLQEIADIVDYETPSAVSKRIDRIAEQYEAFINPLPEGAERAKPEKKRF